MAALRPRPLAAAILGAVGIVVAGVALAFSEGGSPPRAQPTAPLVLAVSFRPAQVGFGDELTATVTVLLDRDAVRPGTLRLADGLAPLTQLGPAQTSRTVSGRLETVSERVSVACLTDACAARAGATAVALSHARAVAISRSGRVDVVTADWPLLQMRSRVTTADLAAARPPFAALTSPGAPTFRLSPAALAPALDAVAAACAAAALALLAWQLVILLRRRRPEPGELERALRLVREAERRPLPDRRRALGLLARLLETREGALGAAADNLAWSEPAPDGGRLRELVDRIERSGGT